MIKVSAKKLSKREECIEFYNRYLALDNDELLLRMLINKLGDTFIAKASLHGIKTYLYDLDKDLMSLRFTTDDFEKFSDFEKSILKFYSYATIKLKDGNAAYIDQNGTIISFMNAQEQYNGQNVFDYALMTNDKNALNDAKNVVLQNTLVSKLYQAVLENVASKTNGEGKVVFEMVNDNILSYTDEPRAEIKTNNQVRLRSAR